jgi:hypothetical protein
MHHAIAWLITLGGQPVPGHDITPDRASYHTIEYRQGALRSRRRRPQDECASSDGEAFRLAS